MKAKLGNEEANKALAQQAALLDLSHDCILVRSLDDRVTFWNRSAEELYGWSAAEALGQAPHTLLQTQFSKPLVEIKACLEGAGKWEGELIHTTRDGRVVVMASRWSLQRDSQGTPLAILESDTEVTERKYTEEALRLAREQLELRVQARTADLAAANEALVESQDRFRQMAENIPEVFWFSNPAMTHIIYVSPAYQEIWGRTCQSLYENPGTWFEAIHPEDRPRVRQIFKKPIPEAGYEHSYRVVRPEGTVRWVVDRGVPVPDNAGRFHRLVGVVRDITDRKMLEKETLTISEREQRRIGQDLHDDLCQQLVGIEFISKALQQQLESRPEAARAGEIAQLIRDAINHTRRLARGLAPFELEAEGLMEGLRDLAARTTAIFRIGCSFHCPAPVLVQDVATATHLYRIAQEAVANGIKHGQAKRVEIGLAADGAAITMTVKDNGVGLSTNPPKAPGMGLRIMQYRTDMIGGAFVIQDDPRGGTTIICTVPRASREPARPPAP